MIAWYRSWPAEVPASRAHVIDGLPRLVMSGWDYSTTTFPDDEPGFCLLEWDIALGSEERAAFATAALADPDRVLVAPYPIYAFDGTPHVVHRVAGRPIAPGQPQAETVGLGCIYLPRSILDAWAENRESRFTDQTFSRWHLARYGPVTVDWSVRPQHLHGD